MRRNRHDLYRLRAESARWAPHSAPIAAPPRPHRASPSLRQRAKALRPKRHPKSPPVRRRPSARRRMHRPRPARPKTPAKRRPKVRSLKYRPACACGNIFCALCCSAFLCWGSSPWWHGPSAGMCVKKSAAFRAPHCAWRVWCWRLCCWRLRLAVVLLQAGAVPCKAWCSAPVQAFSQQSLTFPFISAILHTVHSEGELFVLETASRIRWQAETPALLSPAFFGPSPSIMEQGQHRLSVPPCPL